MNGTTERKNYYKLVREIFYIIKKGGYTSDPLTDKKTGYIMDEEWGKLLKGEKIYRTIEKLDGDYGFDTSELPKEEDLIERVFLSPHMGMIRDTGMLKYPFEIGEKISIVMRKNRNGNYVIIIKTEE